MPFEDEAHPLGPAVDRAASDLWPKTVLRTKLLPPRPAPLLLHRGRLLDRLRSNLAFPVTLITADAGSGKTTLVADFIRAQDNPSVWYQLDHTDADPAVFLKYLAHGLRQAVPRCGEATLAYIEQAASEIGRFPERATDVLLNEIFDRLEQRLIIVLDDYHHLGTATAVHRIVERLLAYLPDLLHLVIISRDLPPFQLSRLRSQGALSLIDRNDLLFTDEETRALFAEVFNLALSPAQISECRARTEGWITALQLFWQVAQRVSAQAELEGAKRPDFGEMLRQSERDIFEYFAEEVFAAESAEVQQFLMRVSLLDRIDLDLCRRLYPEVDAATMLSALLHRNVFLTVATDGGGEEYRLHPLFRSFLRRRFRQISGGSEAAAEEVRLAEHLLERHEWPEAISHLIEVRAYERAARLIAEHGRSWLKAGALEALAKAVDAQPAEALEKYPRALAYRAEVERLRGNYDAAEARLRRAAVLLHECGDAEGEAEALHSLATIARRRGDYSVALEDLNRAEALAGEDSPVRVLCGNTRGLCLVAQEEWTAAEAVFRSVLQAAEERADEHQARIIAHNLGLPAMMRGDFAQALRWLNRLFHNRETETPHPQDAPGHLNLARCHLYRGEFDQCEQQLERALELCQLFNLVALRGETLETYGNLWRERGDFLRAGACYDQAARAYDEAGIDPTQRELIEERALLLHEMGETGQARALIEGLASARRERGEEQGLQTARLTWSRLRIAEGAYDEARATLIEVLDYFRARGFYYYEAQAQLALAVCGLASRGKGPDDGLGHLRRALELSARFDYSHWLSREVAAHRELFAAPEAAALLPGNLTVIARTPRAEIAARSSIELPPPPAFDLTINLLGPVEIFRDPLRPFAPDAWTTRRARDIFCYIVAKPHRRASKDLIIDTFWGDADPDFVTKNFHPTISHIRKALNSNQSCRYNFLLYRDGHYLLNPDYSYSIDIERFDRLVDEGTGAQRSGQMEQALACYEAAAGIYRGEFMAGSYDEWLEEQRNYYREQYLHILEALAVSAQKSEEWARSLRLASQILREDSYREDVHCLVMRAYGAQGNRMAVREHYEELRRLLDDELGVEPEAETQRVYRQIVGEDPPRRQKVSPSTRLRG